MLDSLAIRNFRNLKDLTILALGKVNLITGKNNTGKTALLEALAIYASSGDMQLVYQLLKDRGENYEQPSKSKKILNSNARSLSSLFTNRHISFDTNDAIRIGEIEKVLASGILAKDVLSFRFIRYVDELQRDAQGGVSTKRRILTDEGQVNEFAARVKLGFEINTGSVSYIISTEDNGFPIISIQVGAKSENKIQLINTRNVDREINGKLFDSIALTEKEIHVISALKIIEPSTERIAFIESGPGKRTAVIKLSTNQEVLPLRSMGDGINRILTIILALVNAENGYLLIDEFENGLHYTVQEQLWNIIFKLAQELNVQVFATTHSEDCIAAFSRVLNIPNQTLAGKLIRLDNVNGTIKQIEYNAEELKIATDQNIETR